MFGNRVTIEARENNRVISTDGELKFLGDLPDGSTGPLFSCYCKVHLLRSFYSFRWHKESDPSLHRPKNFSIKTVYSNSIVIMGFYCSSIVNFGLPQASIAWLRASLCFKRASRGYHLLGSHSYTSTIWFCRKPPEARLKQREARGVIIEAWRSLALNNRKTIEAWNLNRVMICELYFC